jgi:hypothetical protein
MVTRPTATGAVGGKDRNSSVIERNTPVAAQNAAIQTNAFVIRSVIGLFNRRECTLCGL